MMQIAANYQWLLKKDVFSLLRSHTMPVPVLAETGFVPVKAGTTLQPIGGRHALSILPSYTNPPPAFRVTLKAARENFPDFHLRTGPSAFWSGIARRMAA